MVSLHGQAQEPSAKDHPAYGNAHVGSEPPRSSIEAEITGQTGANDNRENPKNPTPSVHWFWRDPAAQWAMAIASFVALYLLFLNLREARRTVQVTRELGMAQVQAYVTITSCRFQITDANQESIQISLKTSGQSPAFYTRVKFFIVFWEKNNWASRQYTDVRTHFFPDSTPVGAPHPGDTITIEPCCAPHIDDASGTFVTSCFLIFYGLIQYRDVFDRTIHKPFFSGTYIARGTPAHDTFDLTPNPEWAQRFYEQDEDHRRLNHDGSSGSQGSPW